MNEGTQPTGGAIRVGDFVVDPRSGELRGEAGRQLLSAQPLHVLLALAERPGALVTRDELRARLWPADTYVDFEHGLNAIVKRLRDALGDSADTPRYIETVPRRGYRLIAAVRPAESAGHDAGPGAEAAHHPPEAATAAPVATDTPNPGFPPAKPSSAGGARRAAAIALALSVIAVAVYVAIRLGPAEGGGSVPANAADARTTRFTFGPGLQTDATWSPDGRRIAYSADRDGNFDLFTQSLDGGEPVRVTSSPANETQPAWAPDGGRLVFRSDEGGGGLFTVGVNGGPVRRITNMGFRPTWMPNGRDIAFTGTMQQAIYVVRADGGGTPQEILQGQLTNGAWASFAVHPDGRIGLFGIHPTGRLGFYVSDPDHRRLRSVSKAATLPDAWHGTMGRAHWSRTGDAVFVEAVAAGVPTIWRVPVDPVTQDWRMPVQLTTGPAAADHAAISPDGTRLAFTSTQRTTRAWVFPFDADRAGPPGEGRPVTDEDASVSSLALSADGSDLYFLEERPGRAAVRALRLNLDTGEVTVVVDDAALNIVPSQSGRATSYTLLRPPGAPLGADIEYALAWSDVPGHERLLKPWGASAVLPTDVRRDERMVLASVLKSAVTGPAQLVEWPVGPSPTNAPARVLLAADRKQFWQGRYSPDGRWVSFVIFSLEADSGLELGVAPSDSSNASTWTRFAPDHPWPDKPRWSPDGRTLYFLSRAASGFFELWGARLDPSRGAPAGIPFPIARFDSPRWHVDLDNGTCEMGIAKGRLVLPMQTVKGSIWLLSNVGTLSTTSMTRDLIDISPRRH